VKPTAPPPPPSPPRRASKARATLVVVPDSVGEETPRVLPPPIDPEIEGSTAVARYEDARSEPVTHPRGRHDAVEVVFDDETEARPVDDYLLKQLKAEPEPSELAVPYESLPSLEVRQPFDTYEAEFAERDPVTQIAAAQRDSMRLRRAKLNEVRDVREPSYDDAFEPPTVDGEPPPATERLASEGSGPRERPRSPYEQAYESFQSGPQERGWSSEPPPPEPMIPPAPAVPREISSPPAFIQGVQPIRPGAFPAPAPAGMMRPATPPMMQPMPAAPRYTPSPSQAVRAAPAANPHAAPTVMARAVGGQLGAREPGGVSRFVWFVFGVAFGVAFALVAAGLVPGLGKEPEPIAFPPPAPLPTQVAAVTPPAAATTAAANAANAANAAVAAPPPVASAPAAPAAPPVIASASAGSTSSTASRSSTSSRSSKSSAANEARPEPKRAKTAERRSPPATARRSAPGRKPASPPKSEAEAPSVPKKIGTSTEPPPPAVPDGIGNILGAALDP
jgi:hypothetical protein